MNQFEAEADKWWDSDGPFSLLHKMNPIRLRYIRDHIGDPLGKKAIDIGCGGGILTIPMARMGMEISGLDIGKKNIDVAKAKTQEAELNIDYYVKSIEEIATLPQHREQYDLVTSMEVIEHVNDYKIFLIHLCKLVKPGGHLIISTINRTPQSYLKAIVAAEYILNIVPKGTHQWKSFLKPSEITEVVEACDLKLIDIRGMKLDWKLSHWQESQDISINYIMSFKKK